MLQLDAMKAPSVGHTLILTDLLLTLVVWVQCEHNVQFYISGS